VRHLTSPDVVRVARAIQRELSLRADASALVLEGLALELLGESGRESTAGARDSPAWLRQAREELDDGFRDPRLRLGELAAAVGVHPVHLARAFRRHFGASPGEYVRRLRVDWAARAVAEGPQSLADIAQLAGFADQSHMTRMFRRELGTTPGELRRRRRAAPRSG
jgi:AraC family transcriptional regulator